MAQRRSILVIGGGSTGPPFDAAPLSQEIRDTITKAGGLKQALAAMTKDAADKGFDVRPMQLHDPRNVDDWIEQVGRTLASQHWDGFIIGNGIRGTPSLTAVFERLVAVGREKAPETPMGFNTTPLDVLDAIERMFAS